MRTIKIIVLGLFLLGLCYGVVRIASSSSEQGESIDSLLVVLDRTIADKTLYAQIRQNNIDSLKRRLVKETNVEKKIGLAQQIFDLYFDFQNDLAMEYVVLMHDLAEKVYGRNPDYLWMADINRARLLRYTGQLKESVELLDEIGQQRLSPTMHYLYVSERVVSYSFLHDHSPTPEYQEYYDMMTEIYRDSVFMYADKTAVIIKAERFLKQNSPQEALVLLHDEYDTLPPLSKRAGTLAYNIALCHGEEGDTLNLRRYLILSAIADLHNGVRGYKSLQHLAVEMYRMGEIDRAYNYMKCSMEDAIESSARIRAQEASEMFVIIDESYQKKVATQNREIFNLLIGIGVVGVLLLVSLFVISYQNARLVAAKRNLSEANLIKEGYLGVFIEEYSNYLSKMNSYRVKSVKILKKKNLDEIQAFINEALNTTDDQRELYKKFDATILSIFPTFIEEFNQLMNEGGTTKKNDGQELTAEQRIAAFIRLGIKETEKIALFLRYSVRTVYNYRSQMRAKARNPKDLEQEIMRIGIVQSK